MERFSAIFHTIYLLYVDINGEGNYNYYLNVHPILKNPISFILNEGLLDVRSSRRMEYVFLYTKTIGTNCIVVILTR
jgi:hypothetical protein